ncbi:MAG: alpha/beta fold hydrolase [Thermoanaerobaculia bacterium]
MELLTHRSDGTGPALLLLNGGMMSFAAWEEIAAPLAAHYRVIRCDFRGQLLSPGDPPRTIGGHVEDVAALLDSLGCDRVHVAGTSFGAFVALQFAAEHPSRTASVIAITASDRVRPAMWEKTLLLREACLDAAAGGDRQNLYDILTAHTFSESYRTREAATLALRRQQVAYLPDWWFRGIADSLLALENLDLTPLLPRITAPTLVVAADHDVTFPPAESKELASRIPGARLALFEDCGHGLVMEQPARLTEVLRDWIRGVEAGTAGAFAASEITG